MGTTTSCSGQSRTVVNHDCILVLDISVEFKVVTLLVTLIANITKNLQAYPIDLKPSVDGRVVYELDTISCGGSYTIVRDHLKTLDGTGAQGYYNC